MLPTTNMPTLTVLLAGFRACFTAPGYRTFSSLAVGLIAQTRRRTVCALVILGCQAIWLVSGARSL